MSTAAPTPVSGDGSPDLASRRIARYLRTGSALIWNKARVVRGRSPEQIKEFRMPAYCLFDNLEVLDPAALEHYKVSVAPIVEAFGGRYVVLGGPVQRLEGEWSPTFPVMIEFADMAAAEAWYNSPQYAPFKALRLAATRSSATLFAGLPAEGELLPLITSGPFSASPQPSSSDYDSTMPDPRLF